MESGKHTIQRNMLTSYHSSTESATNSISCISKHESHFYMTALGRPDGLHSLQFNEPEKLVRYEILWLKQGSSLLNLNHEIFRVGINEVCFLTPGQIRTIQITPDATGYYISLSPDLLTMAGTESLLLSLQFRDINSPIRIPTEMETNSEIGNILLKMHHEFSGEKTMRSELLNCWLKAFILYLSRSFSPDGTNEALSREMSFVNRFIQLVSQQFITRKMVTDYANELCVTRGYLNYIVKKVTGFTASYFIQHCVILEAKKEAIHSGRSMKEIAYRLGFDDTAHFSKFFKTNCGINFSDFRKRTELSHQMRYSAD